MNQSSTPQSIQYRPHIDGLRGMAVIAVVLYHAKLLLMRGGFVGVDVFFVISGFLITSIILRDLSAGTFSLARFWQRRIRRIVPALAVVVVCSSIAAYFLILYPPDYVHFGASVIAQSIFASNIFFMMGDNYFDQPSRFSPLLHTWSLSVEEQFYLLFPVIIMITVWLSRRLWSTKMSTAFLRTRLLLPMVLVLTSVSLGLSIWWVNMFPGSALHIPAVPTVTLATVGFYSLFARAWELAVGIVIALAALKIRSRIVSEIIALFGIGAITLSIFLFKDGMSFPGMSALVPTLGAGAFIVANENHTTRIGDIFSRRTLVWVGLISYSLYLWHWPLFVFANLVAPAGLSKIAFVGLVAVAVACGWLSYRYIETPFRDNRVIPKQWMVYVLGVGVLSSLAYSGYVMKSIAPALSYRIPTEAARLLRASAIKNVAWGSDCFTNPGDTGKYEGICRIGTPGVNVKTKFVVWGDSHADALVPLFDAMGASYGAQGIVFDDADCVPVAGVHEVPAAIDCESEKATARRFVEDHDIKNIILVARWSLYVRGGPDAVPRDFVTDGSIASTSPQEAARILEVHLSSMVAQLTGEGRKVIIVEQVPEQIEFSMRDAFYRSVHTGQGIQFHGITTYGHETYQILPHQVLQSLSRFPQTNVLDPATILCTILCDLERSGVLIYRDDNHLSTAGAMLLEPLFRNVFENMRSVH
jgi:peptidoglycan/LPS O-acetylase OafA/YrhL